MPGEGLEDAMAAAESLKSLSISTVFTHLGENVADAGEAARVTSHYEDSLEKIRTSGLGTHVSVKLTQLGLDLGAEVCLRNLEKIVEKAGECGTIIWIDMEQSPYVDRTIGMYREVRKKHANVGICLQAYLRRTEKDIVDLLGLSPMIRLVKGAYLETPAVVFPKKRDVDENYFTLSTLLLRAIKSRGVSAAIATHDRALIARIRAEALRCGLASDQYEFHLLYGIQREEQKRLAREGMRVRALISYGTYWFPWYVRRLAERPANVLFVLKNILPRI